MNKNVKNLKEIIKQEKVAVIHTVEGRIQSISFHPSLKMDATIKRFVISSSAEKCVLLSKDITVRRCKEDQYKNLSTLILKDLKV